jgi:hypothetical protein
MNLSDDAKAKLRERMAESREKLSEASPEERTAYFKKVFDKIEAEDRAGKFKSTENPGLRARPSTTEVRTEPLPAAKRIDAPRAAPEGKLLPQNYRITISGKEADKPLGRLAGLTCTSAVSLDGMLDKSDPPTLIKVTGDFEDKDGSITFVYTLGFNIPVVINSLISTSKDGSRTPVTSTISYKTQVCKGALRMKAGESYEVLKAGGITYSVSIAPEPDK